MSLINKVLYNIDQRDDTTPTQKETARKNIGAYEDKTIAGGGTGIPKSDLASDVQASLGKADSALQAAVEYVTTSSTWQTLETAYNAGKTLILKVENGSNWFDEYRIAAVNKSSGSDRFIFCGFPTAVNLDSGSVKSLEVTEWICYLDGSTTRWINSPTVNGVELTTKDYVAQALTSCMILSKLASDDREIPGDSGYEPLETVTLGSLIWDKYNLNIPVSSDNSVDVPWPNGGKLYKGSCIDTEIIPKLKHGWRIPSSSDFAYLGQYMIDNNYFGATNVFYALAIDDVDYNRFYDPNVSPANTSGFAALMTGYSTNGISISNSTSSTNFWSSELSGSNRLDYCLQQGNSYAPLYHNQSGFWLSIRVCKNA